VTPGSTAILLNIVDPANPAKRMLSATPLIIGTQPANGISIADIDGDGDPRRDHGRRQPACRARSS
jgi:hypothetical protein